MRGTEERGGEIRAAPAQRGGNAVRGGAEESLGDRNAAGFHQRSETGPRALGHHPGVGRGTGEAVVRDYDSAHVDPGGCKPGALERGGHQPGAPELAPAGDQIQFLGPKPPAERGEELCPKSGGILHDGRQRCSRPGDTLHRFLVARHQAGERDVQRRCVSGVHRAFQSQ